MLDLAMEREAVREAGRRAEYPPGSMAAGSLAETRNVVRARVAKCLVSIHNPSDGMTFR